MAEIDYLETFYLTWL